MRTTRIYGILSSIICLFFIQYSYSALPKDIIMCFGKSAAQATKTAKAHSGAVSTPVGSNIGGLRKWSANSTWNGDAKPVSGDDVTIPANAVVVLDQNVDVRSITVEGKLIVDLTKNVNINVEYIMIMGGSAYFEWGTSSEPYNRQGTITLIGNDVNKKIPGTNVESKAIMVMNGGTIELHGEEKVSWSKLDANASAGSNTITIKDANSNWAVGDEILIAPSRTNWNEGEKRIITAISGDKKTLRLNSGLSYPHIGNVHTYTRPNDGKTWTGDMRAEVGMLSKSIKIQGDNTSESNQFGGHVMIHTNGYAYIESVEFYRMGQKSILGRYPFHWHLVEERGAGQYLKDCSIHRTYNRAITIHGTESTLVENNFCYDHIGHGLFLEDGSERFNVIRGNVVLLTKRPAAGEELTPSDNEMNEVQNRTPASFWITNPNNTFENNVAAGTQGTGFWFAMPTSPMGPSANIPRFNGLQPHREPLGKFSGNTAHSCKSGFDIFDQLRANHSIVRNAPWQRTDKRYMDNCTWYACDLAVYGGIGGGRTYTEDVVFRNNVFLDNITSVMHANYAVIDESVFVANSGENVFNGERKLNRGYDGSCTISNCHLVGWQASNANYVQNTGGANKHVNYRITGMTMDHQGPPRMSFPDYSRIPRGNVGANANEHPRFWSYIHWDMDGSFGGKANTSIVTNHPLCRDGTEVRYENWTNLYRTDRRFAYITMVFHNKAEIKASIVRTKPGTPKAGQYYINGFYGQFIQFPAMVNDDFLYTIQFESLPPNRYFNIRMQDDYIAGDEVLVRVKDFGRLGGVKLDGQTRYNSVNELKAANGSGYVIVGDYLYFKMVSIASNPDRSFRVSWTSDITLPTLDTDGDGKSDYQESVDGTDPIENDPIPTNPVLPLITTPIPPTVQMTSPQEGAVFELGQTISLAATASDSDGNIVKVNFKVNGGYYSQDVTSPYTGSFTPTTSGTYFLSARAFDNDGETTEEGVNITVVEPETKEPYTGTPIAIPGTLEAENYDKGGEGVSYYDTDAVNNGGEYRNDAVDIGGGNGSYTIGWTASGEWLEYTVQVNATGLYDLEFVTSSLNGGGVIDFELDGNDLNATHNVPQTGDWNTYTSSYKYALQLPQGEHLMRINIASSGFNLDKIVFTPAATDCEGTPGGTLGPGSPCDDGDVCTINDTYDSECNCVGESASPVVTTSLVHENCDDPGSVVFSFEDVSNRSHIAFSMDAGASYPLYVADNSTSASFDNVEAGTYNLFTRWGNGECPVDLGEVTITEDPKPEVVVSSSNPQGYETTGSIHFTYADIEKRTNIEFSMDGGSTYPLNVSDASGNASFEEVLPGDYNVWARWGNDDCPIDLGLITVSDPPRDCDNYTNGTASMDECGICSGGNTGITPSSPQTWYEDTDGDGVGSNVAIDACAQPDGYVATNGDQCPEDINKTEPGACGCGVEENTCTPPSLSFTKPLNNQNIEEGTTIVVNVAADDEDGEIDNVKLFLNGTLVRQENVAPYDWNHIDQDPVFNSLNVGEHVLKAVAEDNHGNLAETSITIIITEAPRDCNGDIRGTASIDDCGLCSGGNTGKPVNDCITAINAIDNDRLEIYPIPATDKLNLSKSVSWRLVDIFGNQLKEGKSESISLIDHSPGIYFLMVGGKTYRIIKE